MTNFNPSATRSFRRNPQKEKGRDLRRTLLPQTAKLLVITLFCSLLFASCGVGVDTARINVQTPPLFDLDTYPGIMVAGFHFKYSQAPQTDLDKLSRELIKEDLAIFFKKPITEAPKADSAAFGRLEEIERDMIQRTLEAEQGNISAAARRLGISRNTLYRKLGRM